MFVNLKKTEEDLPEYINILNVNGVTVKEYPRSKVEVEGEDGEKKTVDVFNYAINFRMHTCTIKFLAGFNSQAHMEGFLQAILPPMQKPQTPKQPPKAAPSPEEVAAAQKKFDEAVDSGEFKVDQRKEERRKHAYEVVTEYRKVVRRECDQTKKIVNPETGEDFQQRGPERREGVVSIYHEWAEGGTPCTRKTIRRFDDKTETQKANEFSG